VGQFVAPRITEGAIESRLTKHGGTAHAHVRAFPWPRLLFTDGDSLDIDARGVRLDVGGGNIDALGPLDGFGAVDIRLTSSTAGPVHVKQMTLRKQHGSVYRFAVTGSVTPAALLTFAAGVPPPPPGAPGIATAPAPIDVTATLRSTHGRTQVVTASGTIARIPIGALARVLVGALADRV
jgi:hypothetical protein